MPSDQSTPTVERAPTPLRVAVALIGLEALALLGGAVFLAIDTIAGSPANIGRALLGAALALCGAAVLAMCARALLRLRPSARSPVVVLQLLALPVGYSLGFQAGLIAYGGPILVIALVVLFLLFTPPVREVLDRQ